MGRLKQSRGFTLIELMIVVALLGIFAAIAVPSFTSFTNNNRTQAASNELLSFLQYARSTAVQNNSTYIACLGGAQWTLKTACADTAALRTLLMPTNVDLIANIGSISFRSNGTASSAATITVCHNSQPANGFTVNIQSSGITRVWPRGKTQTGESMSTCTP
jgi:type IV fimbrial biogenesis protein FimU